MANIPYGLEICPMCGQAYTGFPDRPDAGPVCSDCMFPLDAEKYANLTPISFELWDENGRVVKYTVATEEYEKEVLKRWQDCNGNKLVQKNRQDVRKLSEPK